MRSAMQWRRKEIEKGGGARIIKYFDTPKKKKV